MPTEKQGASKTPATDTIDLGETSHRCQEDTSITRLSLLASKLASCYLLKLIQHFIFGSKRPEVNLLTFSYPCTKGTKHGLVGGARSSKDC